MAGIKERNETLKKETYGLVVYAINTLVAAGKSVSPSSVAKAANISRQTIYKNPDLIDMVKGFNSESTRSKEAQNTIISIQAEKIQKLENALLKASKKIERAEKLKEENERLKKDIQCLRNENRLLYEKSDSVYTVAAVKT